MQGMNTDMTVIDIDPNVRTAGNETYAGWEDVHGAMPSIGELVVVREPESGITGTARVTDIEDKGQLIYLAVLWKGLRAPDRSTH
jgi:hypothetical protein